jgi:hypothetical protein
VQLLELRHRGHARVEDRIRTGKDSGFGRFPSRQFAINQAWLELALMGIDLLAWTRLLLLDGEHTLAEPKKLRYRLCTWPPGSCAPPGERTCAWPKPGPGQTFSRPRSPAWPPYRDPSPKHALQHHLQRTRRNPATCRRTALPADPPAQHRSIEDQTDLVRGSTERLGLVECCTRARSGSWVGYRRCPVLTRFGGRGDGAPS